MTHLAPKAGLNTGEKGKQAAHPITQKNRRSEDSSFEHYENTTTEDGRITTNFLAKLLKASREAIAVTAIRVIPMTDKTM
jgi:hypothetical protein